MTKKNFEDYLKVVNRLEFGSFDEFEGIDNWNIEELEHIDLFELYEDVRRSPRLKFTVFISCSVASVGCLSL